MEQRLSLLTLGVVDLARSRRFYEEGLGWRASGASTAEVAFFQLGAIALALWGREELAADAGLSGPGPGDGFAGVALAHNVPAARTQTICCRGRRWPAAVSQVGHGSDWGGYTGYFARSRRPFVGGCLESLLHTARRRKPAAPTLRADASPAAGIQPAGGMKRWRDLLEHRQRLACCRVAGQRGVRAEVDQVGMRLAGKAQGAGSRDVGMADGSPNQYGPGRAARTRFQDLQDVTDLCPATVDPCLRGLRMERPLVEQAHRLVGEPGGQGADPQRASPLGPPLGDQRPLRPRPSRPGGRGSPRSPAAPRPSSSTSVGTRRSGLKRAIRPRRRRSTRADARTAWRRAAARSRHAGRRGNRTGRSGSSSVLPGSLQNRPAVGRPVGGSSSASRLWRSRLTLASMWAVIGADRNRNTPISGLMIGRVAALQPEIEGRGEQQPAGTEGRGLGGCVQALDQRRQPGRGPASPPAGRSCRPGSAASDQEFGQELQHAGHSITSPRSTYLQNATVLTKPIMAISSAASK